MPSERERICERHAHSQGYWANPSAVARHSLEREIVALCRIGKGRLQPLSASARRHALPGHRAPRRPLPRRPRRRAPHPGRGPRPARRRRRAQQRARPHAAGLGARRAHRAGPGRGGHPAHPPRPAPPLPGPRQHPRPGPGPLARGRPRHALGGRVPAHPVVAHPGSRLPASLPSSGTGSGNRGPGHCAHFRRPGLSGPPSLNLTSPSGHRSRP